MYKRQLASQGVKGSVTNALSAAFLGSLGGGKSFANNLLVYYAVLNGARALIVDPKAERGNWKHDLPEISDEVNIVNLCSDGQNRGMLDPYVIMRRPKEDVYKRQIMHASVLRRWMYGMSSSVS